MVRMEKEEKPCRLYPSVRLMMFLLVLLGCTMLGGGFAAFNFAIVCMTNETAVDEGQQSGWNQSRCGLSAGVSEEEVLTKKGYDGEFNWDRSVQASLLAAHSIGAIFVNVPAGLFSDRYGSKWIFGVSVLMSGIASALTPVAAYAGVPWLFATRILEGKVMTSCDVMTTAIWTGFRYRSRYGVAAGPGHGLQMGYAGRDWNPRHIRGYWIPSWPLDRHGHVGHDLR